MPSWNPSCAYQEDLEYVPYDGLIVISSNSTLMDYGDDYCDGGDLIFINNNNNMPSVY